MYCTTAAAGAVATCAVSGCVTDSSLLLLGFDVCHVSYILLLLLLLLWTMVVLLLLVLLLRLR
jgi:hypothetical protein